MKKGSKIIIMSLILLILCIVCFLLLNINVGKKEEKKSIEEVISAFSFEGVLNDKIIFDDKYASLIYKKDNKLISHFISLEDEEELEISNIIKENSINDFENIIKELLLKKYPSKIVDILLNQTEKTYAFDKNYLEITFYDNEKIINTKKTFNIKINYKHIKDYLIFNVEDSSFKDEDGYSYDPNKTSVVFTFDDGPNGNKTKKIISYLEDYKMSATFFMLGNKIVNGADTIKLVNLSHSEIGYHSYSHSYMTAQTKKQLEEEFNLSKNLLKEYAGAEYKYVRAPYGSYNDNVLASINLPFIKWNVDTNDWRYKDPDYTENHVLTHIKDGNIILFHDSYETTVEAIERLVEDLYLKDIQVMSISSYAALKNIEMKSNTNYFNF